MVKFDSFPRYLEYNRSRQCMMARYGALRLNGLTFSFYSKQRDSHGRRANVGVAVGTFHPCLCFGDVEARVFHREEVWRLFSA